MIKLLNKFLLFLGWQLTRTIPKQKKTITRKLTKIAVARRFNLKYSQVGWLHVSFVNENPNISKKELLLKVAEYFKARRLESKKTLKEQRSKILIHNLNSIQNNPAI